MLRSLKSLLLAAIAASGLISTAHAMSGPEGMVVVPSPHSVKETLDKLAAVLESKGMKIMARVDHSAGAASVDLELRPTELMIFGNPQAKISGALANFAKAATAP